MTNDLPQGWQWSTLGQACSKPQYGWTTKSIPGAGLPYLRTTDISGGDVDWPQVPACVNEPDKPDDFLLRDGDIVVSRAGTVGVSLLLKDPPRSVFASYLIRLRTHDGLSPAYVAYFLRSPQYWTAIADSTIGIAVPNVNARKLAAIRIPVAPRHEQDRIVAAIDEHFSRLDAANSAVDAAQTRLNVLQRSAAKTLFDRLNCPWTTLGEIAALKGGIAKDAKRESDPDYLEYPYLRVANVQRGFLDLAEVATIRADPRKATKLVLQTGDILFNEGGDRDKLGRGWVWEGQLENCIHQNHVFRARLVNGGFDPYFVSMHANTWGQRWFEAHGKQTTNLASLNLTTLKSFPVPAPSRDDQRAVVDKLQTLKNSEDHLRTDLDRAELQLRALRRSILSMAFSGQLVPQDPADESASILLDRIRASRTAKPRQQKVDA